MSQYTTTIIIAVASGLSTLFIVLIAVFITAIGIFIRRRKKKPHVQTESDVYYDTINIGHHPTRLPVVETEINVAYHHPKKLK